MKKRQNASPRGAQPDEPLPVAAGAQAGAPKEALTLTSPKAAQVITSLAEDGHGRALEEDLDRDLIHLQLRLLFVQFALRGQEPSRGQGQGQNFDPDPDHTPNQDPGLDRARNGASM